METTRNLACQPEALRQIVSLLGEHDPGSLRHSRRVARLSRALAATIGASHAECEAAGLAGLLHDVGKISVPSAILIKPGPLSRDEAAVMRTHAGNGERMLRPFVTAEIAHVAGHHHDRLDAVPGLPWMTRLVSVADSFDALVSDRPYRAACAHDTALDELARAAGNQLDEDLVEALITASLFSV